MSSTPQPAQPISRTAETQTEISLTNLTEQLRRQRLTDGFAAAVADVQRRLEEEARQYQGQIEAALRGGNSARAQQIIDELPYVFGFDETTQRVTAANFENVMMQFQGAFVAMGMEVLSNGMDGGRPSTASFAIPIDPSLSGSARETMAYQLEYLAGMLAESLATTFTPPHQPNTVAFESANVAEGQLPLTFEIGRGSGRDSQVATNEGMMTIENTITIGWPSWINVGGSSEQDQTSRLDAVPKPTRRRA